MQIDRCGIDSGERLKQQKVSADVTIRSIGGPTDDMLHVLLLPMYHQSGEKTPRAWQLIEENGLRTQVWRTDPAASAAMLALDAGILPSNQDLQAVHFASSPMDSPAPFVSELRKRSAVMLGHEVYTHNTEAGDPNTIRGLVTAASFFSPNVLEAECLLESLRAARDGDRFVAPLEEPGDVTRALEVAMELSSIHGDQNLLLRQVEPSLNASRGLSHSAITLRPSSSSFLFSWLLMELTPLMDS